jgi:transcriptional regulator with XRE-family HTH domain
MRINIVGGLNMKDIINRIGKLVKEKRIEKGYSTQELAEKLEVSSGLVNNIENGKTDTFNIELMEKLSSVLDMEILPILANKSDDVKKLLSITKDIPENLSAQINKVIEAYINAAIELNFNHKKLEALLSKLLYEIDFMMNTRD